MRIWSKIDGGVGDVYCDTCNKVHPQYLTGCVPKEPVVYNFSEIAEEKRRREITRWIIENTKSF